jgi:hypothetical protein
MKVIFSIKGLEAHIYISTSVDLASYELKLQTVLKSPSSPYPDVMSFYNYSDMVRKLDHIAEIYGYKVEYINAEE